MHGALPTNISVNVIELFGECRVIETVDVSSALYILSDTIPKNVMLR